MANRVSALEGIYQPGRFGSDGEPGVTLQLVRDLQLAQVAAWPDSIADVGQLAAQAVGTRNAPAPGRAAESGNKAILRVEPLKWWLIGADVPQLEADQGATLDLSHSRTMLLVTGDQATELLNRLIPLDLREASFPEGSVGPTALHHVGIVVWRSNQGYGLLIPRGYAQSIWEVLMESALQFGVTVV